MPTQTITIKVPQKLKKDFMHFMGIRLRMKNLYPDINPADAILILVAKVLIKEESTCSKI